MSTNQPTTNTTTTREEELAYQTIRNRHNLSMEEIQSALTDVLEPDSQVIIRFVENLPHMRRANHKCSICRQKYGRHADAPCGSHAVTHVFGADFVRYWLKEHESCRKCHARVFTAPVVGHVWAHPEMQTVVVSLYTVTGRFLAWQDKYCTIMRIGVGPLLSLCQVRKEAWFPILARRFVCWPGSLLFAWIILRFEIF